MGTEGEGPGVGGGGILKFYTYVGSGHFLGLIIFNFNIFGFFFSEKNDYFWGY